MPWVLPFGLKCKPRMLTKVLKPVVAFLRVTWGILIAIYMDDILIQGSSPSQVYLHAQVAALLFMVLGWSLIWEKSDFFPKTAGYPSWLCSGFCLYDCLLPSR